MCSAMEAYDFYRDVYHLKDEELIQKFAKATRRKKLKKGEFVVRIGEILNHVYFMESGILRGYFLDEDGREVTDCFCAQCGCTAMPFGQMELNVLSPISIEILEDGEFFFVSISEVIALQKDYLEITLLYNRLLIQALEEHRKLKQVLNQYTALQRYQWFLQEYPGLIERVRNKYIVSFLGITPVTLSRLRRSLREAEEKEAE